MKKRFSMKNKLLIIFGLLIAFAASIEGVLAVRTSHQAVTEKIETHLTDKAMDTAEIIDGRIQAFLQFLEGIARMPMLANPSITYQEKVQQLEKEAKFNERLEQLNLYDLSGTRTTKEGQIVSVKDREWFKSAAAGKNFISEPLISRSSNILTIVFAVPLYDANRNIIGVLNCVVKAAHLSNDIKDIVVGRSGYCYILGQTGTTIAHKDLSKLEKLENTMNAAKTDSSLKSLAAFEKMAIEINKPSVGYYEYNQIKKIASYAAMKTTGWVVIINAPVEEFMGTVDSLKKRMLLIGFSILSASLITVYIVARRMVKPIQTAVTALRNIAQGEGDLTVRLPLIGNDEVTDLSEYFNQTIAKIGASIQIVGTNTDTMKDIGEELAGNMSETAGAVHQISVNIDGVKQQTLTQSASVTETASTIEEIIHTIKQLNNNIETQAASVAQSSASIEQMVANIASITQTLEKTDNVIQNLAAATGDGKDTIATANTVTQKITEESGSLMEASNVIQHIASQTNLLAMNAAIEAAHAGEAGKGFAVVADEIRKLAEESSMQGKTITSTLKTLSGEIETLSTSSKTVEEKFNIIFDLAAQVKTMSERLTEAMHEQENGSKEVLSAIKNINSITVEVNNGSAEMLKGGKQVASEMHKLDDLTRIITSSMNEMASGAVQINNAVQEVSEITQKNKQSIENLAGEVGKFKV